jgi:hypothetical protein
METGERPRRLRISHLKHGRAVVTRTSFSFDRLRGPPPGPASHPWCARAARKGRKANFPLPGFISARRHTNTWCPRDRTLSRSKSAILRGGCVAQPKVTKSRKHHAPRSPRRTASLVLTMFGGRASLGFTSKMSKRAVGCNDTPSARLSIGMPLAFGGALFVGGVIDATCNLLWPGGDIDDGLVGIVRHLS